MHKMHKRVKAKPVAIPTVVAVESIAVITRCVRHSLLFSASFALFAPRRWVLPFFGK
jgi:hypothetical protein